MSGPGSLPGPDTTTLVVCGVEYDWRIGDDPKTRRRFATAAGAAKVGPSGPDLLHCLNVREEVLEKVLNSASKRRR